MKTRRSLVGALLVLLAVLLVLAPNEKKLGHALRFVLLHGAVTWVSFVIFIIFGVAALLYLLSGKRILFDIAAQTQKVGTGLWFVNFLIWVPLGYLEWNVVAWSGEPKAVAAVWVMLFLAVGYIAAQVTANPKILAGLYLLISIGIWWRYSGVGRVLHPLDPVGSSESLLIKGSFIAILVVCLCLALVLSKPNFSKQS
jgi:hypothetical protein